VIYLAAAMIVAGVALFVAAPLAAGFIRLRRRDAQEFEIERLQHERGLAVQGLRELEFDREMGKLSDADYESLHTGLESRALGSMEALDKLRAEMERAAAEKKPARRVEPIRRPPPPPPSPLIASPPRSIAAGARVRFCPRCGARTPANAKFCGECGISLHPAARSTGWAD
jgi:NADH pyrophosphatase NudC (nudix superfamily)